MNSVTEQREVWMKRKCRFANKVNNMNDPLQAKGVNVFNTWTKWSPFLLSVLRIAAAFIFMQSGTMKLFAFPMGIPPNGGTVDIV